MIYTTAARFAALSHAGMGNNPFFALDNFAASAVLSGTAGEDGAPLSNAVTGSTYDAWRPVISGGAATFAADFGSARGVSFAAIAVHNAAGGSVALEYYNGSAWVDCGCGAVVAQSEAVAFRFSPVSAQQWRFSLSGLSSGFYLAVAFIGREIVMPMRLYASFAPRLTDTEIELQSNISNGGNLLGAVMVSTGSTVSANIEHLPAAFIRGADWLAFQEAYNRGQPAFFGWRPAKYPQDLHYIARSGAVIRPENMGTRDLMAVTVEGRVYANG